MYLPDCTFSNIGCTPFLYKWQVALLYITVQIRFSLYFSSIYPIQFEHIYSYQEIIMVKRMALLPILLLLSGCLGRIPEPVDYEFSEQQKMQAAHHWNVLAKDVANRVNNELIINDYLEKPVFIRSTCGDEDLPCTPYETTTFEEAFRDLLITDLVNMGVPVKQKLDDESITVHYKVQLVYHRSNRVRTVRPGLMTALTTGIMVLRNVPNEISTIAAAAAIDVANQNLVSHSHYEVIITTSMIIGDTYFYRGSDIYYINDKDSFHYRSIKPETATIPLIAPPEPVEDEVVNKKMKASSNIVQPAPITGEVTSGTVIEEVKPK